MALTKKIVHAFLALTLLMATIGVTLNKHYCMGRLKSVAVNAHAHGCSGAGMADPMPCCEDVSQVLKVHDMTTSSFEFKLASIDHFVAVAPTFYFTPALPSERLHFPTSPAPPDDGADVLIRYQVFRI